jgi:DNA-binding CsgD family transcriptional regulator/tetratricopeptide (TPR) repeat protein
MPDPRHAPAMNLPKTALTLVRAGQAPGARLHGRSGECEMLDRLAADVRAGQSRVLVLRGEPGTGKTALLDYLAQRADGCRVARVTGAEPETELAFAGLHQLCAPFLGRLGQLPEPQRDALRTVFSMQGGNAPGRFAVGMATLSLLSDLARERPLVAVVDDAQWLDQASAQALAFAARHLAAAPAAVVFAERPAARGQGLAGLPEFQLGGLADADARALLDSVLIGPLDVRVRDQIIAEARGRPQALLGLTRGLTPGELAGGFGLPAGVPVPGRIEEDYRRRLAPLPAATQLLLLIAAAEPAGDPVLLWRAAGHLAIQAEAAEPAVAAGLAEFSGRVRFCHPQARASVYRAATPRQRQRVHRALAETAGSDVSPEQLAWHRAHATPHLDEDVAAELARSAGQACARGGLPAAAAFGERAAELTPEPACRARRALDAAQAMREAGAPDAARRLLAVARGGPLDELGRARAELLGAQLAARPGPRPDGRLLLLDAASRLEPLDAGLARDAYREAFGAALTAGRLGPAGEMTQVAAAVRAASASAPRPPRAADLLLDALAALVTDGHRVGAPMLKRAVSAFRGEAVPAPDALRWLPFACRMSCAAWDDQSWHALSARLIELARAAGALTALPDALQDGTALRLATGQTAMAMAMAREAETVAAATGNPLRPYGVLLVAAWQGHEAETARLTAAGTADPALHADGQRLTAAAWATAVLSNGLSRYDEALAAAEEASADPGELGLATGSLAELIEAAARTGALDRAASALRRLSEATSAAGTDWALGIQARSAALLSGDEHAERLYLEALERLSRTRIRAELARAHLLYGEWLRRQGRRCDAREQLRTAHAMLDEMGMEGFAERARKELAATGETVRKRTIETTTDLTAQEAHIARLARDGHSNPQISTQLFISPRTVEWHLRKVFTKLGISSRRELRTALPDLIPVPALPGRNPPSPEMGTEGLKGLYPNGPDACLSHGQRLAGLTARFG